MGGLGVRNAIDTGCRPKKKKCYDFCAVRMQCGFLAFPLAIRTASASAKSENAPSAPHPHPQTP